MKINLETPYNGTLFHPTFALLCDGETLEMLIPGEESLLIHRSTAIRMDSPTSVSFETHNGMVITSADDPVIDIVFWLYDNHKLTGPHYI